MSNPRPLQSGDVAPDLSDYNFSNEADRRPQETYTVRSNPQNYHGDYPASDQSRSEGGRIFKVGQATPTQMAPWPVVQMDGDNNGQPAEIHELNIDAYGDCYDSTAPIRVRTVAPAEAHWSFDSDHDGHRN